MISVSVVRVPLSRAHLIKITCFNKRGFGLYRFLDMRVIRGLTKKLAPKVL